MDDAIPISMRFAAIDIHTLHFLFSAFRAG